MDVDLPCHGCGYDLRADPRDGICPECGASVAERGDGRRFHFGRGGGKVIRVGGGGMPAGMWVLVLLPLMDVVRFFEWTSSIPVPSIFDYRSFVTLDDTLICEWGVYQRRPFCIGVVLLFSKERGRRRGQLDWTRRWGVLCSYVVLLLSAVSVLFICALVMTGMSAIFVSIPPKYQPGATQWFVDVSTTYLRYGPHPKSITSVVLVAFSSIAILLACIALFDALRSSGPKRLAMILLAPLGLFALMHLAQAGRYCLGMGGPSSEFFRYELYFCPQLLLAPIIGLPGGMNVSGWVFIAFLGEVAKWCIVLAIAVWLSIARFTAWRGGEKTSAGMIAASVA